MNIIIIMVMKTDSMKSWMWSNKKPLNNGLKTWNLHFISRKIVKIHGRNTKSIEMSTIFIEKNKRIVWTHFNQIQTATMTLNTSCHQSYKRSVFMALVANILIDGVEKLSAAHQFFYIKYCIIQYQKVWCYFFSKICL